MKRIKIIGKTLLVAAFITGSFASASEQEQIWQQIDKLEKQVIGLVMQGMDQGQKTQMHQYENEKKDIEKKEALTSRQKGKQKEKIDVQINKFVQEWLKNLPDTEIKKQIRELQKKISGLGWKKFQKGALYGTAKSLLSHTIKSILDKPLKALGKKGQIVRFYIDHAVNLSADGMLKEKYGLGEKKEPTFLTSTIDFTMDTGSQIIIEKVLKSAEEAVLKKWGKSLDSLSFNIPLKLPLIGKFSLPIPIGPMVRQVVENVLIAHLSEFLKATADNSIETIKNLSKNVYHDALNYYHQLMAKASATATSLFKKKHALQLPAREGEQKIINSISSQLQRLQVRLKQASETLYKKNKPYYYSAAVKNLKTSINLLENSVNNLPEKYDDLNKMVNLDEESAKTWRESLKNIVKIVTKWYKLFADQTINFSNRTAPQVKINEYGNKWYNSMKIDITAYRKKLEGFKNINKIKKHYELLQAMYTAMLSTRYNVEIGVLSKVYYVLGAYAGGMHRLAVGTRAYAHPTFKPEK